MSVLDLENAENWEPRLAQFFTTTPTISLAEYAPNFDFTSAIIVVLVDNSEALSTWYTAGWISQMINLPFGPNATASASNKRLRLREKQLLIFDKLTPTYRISVRFPKWFTQASITVWEYQGPQNETIFAQLNQVETKIDTLLQQHLP
jgi:hypothetical protein